MDIINNESPNGEPTGNKEVPTQTSGSSDTNKLKDKIEYFDNLEFCTDNLPKSEMIISKYPVSQIFSSDESISFTISCHRKSVFDFSSITTFFIP